jgi:hypothetical protein
MMNALYRPNSSELVQLQALTQHPGFDTLKRLMESEIDAMQLSIMNTDPADPNYQVLLSERHRLAKAAAMFYQKVMNRVSNENRDFIAAGTAKEVGADITENLFQ